MENNDQSQYFSAPPPYQGNNPYVSSYNNGYPRTNTLAIVSLLCGLGVLISAGSLALPGIICGHLALKQIKQRGEEGRGMAIAGLVISYASVGVWIAILLLFLMIFIVSGTVGIIGVELSDLMSGTLALAAF